MATQDEKIRVIKRFTRAQLLNILEAYGRAVRSSTSTSDLYKLMLETWNQNPLITERILVHASNGAFYVDKIVKHVAGIRENRVLKLYMVSWESFADMSIEPETNSTIDEHVEEYFDSLDTTEEEANFKLFSKAFQGIQSIKLEVDEERRRPFLAIKCKWNILQDDGTEAVQATQESVDSLRVLSISDFVESKCGINFNDKLTELFNGSLSKITNHYYDTFEERFDFHCHFLKSVALDACKIYENYVLGTEQLNAYLKSIHFDSIDQLKSSVPSRKRTLEHAASKRKRAKQVQSRPDYLNFIIPKSSPGGSSDALTAAAPKIASTSNTRPQPSATTGAPETPSAIEVAGRETLDAVPSTEDLWSQVGFSDGLINISLKVNVFGCKGFTVSLFSHRPDMESLSLLLKQINAVSFDYICKADLFQKMLTDNVGSLKFYSAVLDSGYSEHYCSAYLVDSKLVPLMVFPDQYTFGFYCRPCRVPNVPSEFKNSSQLFITLTLPPNDSNKLFNNLFNHRDKLGSVRSDGKQNWNKMLRKTLYSKVLDQLDGVANIHVYSDTMESKLLRGLLGTRAVDAADRSNVVVLPKHLSLALLRYKRFENVEKVSLMVAGPIGFELEVFERKSRLVMIHSHSIECNSDAVMRYIKENEDCTFLMKSDSIKLFDEHQQARVKEMVAGCRIYRSFETEEVLGMLGWYLKNLEYMAIEIVASTEIKELALMANVKQVILN
eukprot:NODE_241_length_13209_cov_0.424256.p1 type:complete len:725 gc:universal NODE_241_length_13209_cov_0.424256:3249-1075(-)